MGPKPLKSKKARKVFIHDILGKAFDIGFSSYWVAFDQKNHDKMKYFEGECQNLSKVGLQIAKMCFQCQIITAHFMIYPKRDDLSEIRFLVYSLCVWVKKIPDSKNGKKLPKILTSGSKRKFWKTLEDESNNLYKERLCLTIEKNKTHKNNPTRNIFIKLIKDIY